MYRFCSLSLVSECMLYTHYNKIHTVKPVSFKINITRIPTLSYYKKKKRKGSLTQCFITLIIHSLLNQHFDM